MLIFLLSSPLQHLGHSVDGYPTLPVHQSLFLSPACAQPSCKLFLCLSSWIGTRTHFQHLFNSIAISWTFLVVSVLFYPSSCFPLQFLFLFSFSYIFHCLLLFNHFELTIKYAFILSHCPLFSVHFVVVLGSSIVHPIVFCLQHPVVHKYELEF